MPVLQIYIDSYINFQYNIHLPQGNYKLILRNIEYVGAVGMISIVSDLLMTNCGNRRDLIFAAPATTCSIPQHREYLLQMGTYINFAVLNLTTPIAPAFTSCVLSFDYELL